MSGPNTRQRSSLSVEYGEARVEKTPIFATSPCSCRHFLTTAGHALLRAAACSRRACRGMRLVYFFSTPATSVLMRGVPFPALHVSAALLSTFTSPSPRPALPLSVCTDFGRKWAEVRCRILGAAPTAVLALSFFFAVGVVSWVPKVLPPVAAAALAASTALLLA